MKDILPPETWKEIINKVNKKRMITKEDIFIKSYKINKKDAGGQYNIKGLHEYINLEVKFYLKESISCTCNIPIEDPQISLDKVKDILVNTMRSLSIVVK